MKPTLALGAQAEVRITVTEDMCPAFDGVVVHRVYSTWSMAHHMELAARKVLTPHLEPHEEGIGSHLSIDHVAPTPLGHVVRVVAEAIEFGPTTLVCAVTAYHVHAGGETVAGRGKQVQRVLPKTTLAGLIERATHAPSPSS
ncbi:MAG: thioesterase [Phycisphaerales bacterium]|nr:thioesterase [Phycisphaerae bacterium]NNF42221.1 thioesterase [Phycisphaerales bacterium]NNM26860.1 thioesterase [Phycisphaerales bacterium]